MSIKLTNENDSYEHEAPHNLKNYQTICILATAAPTPSLTIKRK